MKQQQQGYTIVELIIVIAFLAGVSIIITIGYVFFHFITNYW